jgi:hypothetical protein
MKRKDGEQNEIFGVFGYLGHWIRSYWIFSFLINHLGFEIPTQYKNFGQL